MSESCFNFNELTPTRSPEELSRHMPQNLRSLSVMFPRTPLFPELLQGDLLVVVLVEDLGGGELEVLLRDVDSPLPQGVHAGLGADALQLGAGAPVHLLGDLGQVDAPRQVHLAAVDAQDVGAGLDRRGRELDLPVDAAGPQQRGVEDVQPVRRHDDLDVLGGLEAVELVQELQHGALDLGIAARGTLHARGADGVDLVHEYD